MSTPVDDLLGNPVAHPLSSDEEELEIRVVDDRPKKDQVPQRIPAEGDTFDPDEEIDGVNKGVKKRINRLRYEFHEQRRKAEASEKMRDEAVRYAQKVASDNGELRELVARGEQVLLGEVKGRADAELSKARDSYKKAYESGDSDELLRAQEDMWKGQYDHQMANSYQITPEGTADQAIQQHQVQKNLQQVQQPKIPDPDPKAVEWTRRNQWFGKDKEMTSLAYGLHERLVKEEGIDPRTDEYYTKIDQRMRELFPERLGGSAVQSRASTVVAPANRNSGAPARKVQLTATQVALAKRLGITPQQYAKQLIKEMENE